MRDASEDPLEHAEILSIDLPLVGHGATRVGGRPIQRVTLHLVLSTVVPVYMVEVMDEEARIYSGWGSHPVAALGAAAAEIINADECGDGS